MVPRSVLSDVQDIHVGVAEPASAEMREGARVKVAEDEWDEMWI